MIAAAASNGVRNSGSQPDTLIRNLEATFYKFQRHNVPFTITNNTSGYGTFSWYVLNLTTLAVQTTSSLRNPSFTLPEGHYLIYGEVQGLNPNTVARIFWHNRIRVLPVMFTSGEADIVLDLDNGNNIIDASGWGDDIKVYCNKLDATVGRIRINDYTGTRAHILVDEPMEINAFAGSSGLYFVNCQNIIFDAVGTTDEYYVTLDGIGVNTSHGVVFNTTADIRCEFIELYGLDIQVDQTGASGVRVLADVSATYNRTLAPLDGIKIAHCKGKAGHEFIYFNVSTESGAGDVNKPRKNINTDVWDILVETCKRDPLQFGNQINLRCHDVTILGAATLGEPSHDSYIVINPGCENPIIFNIFGAGGLHGISVNLGETGTLPRIWNVILKLQTLPSQSSWNFLQTGEGTTTDLSILNATNLAETGDEIVYRLDASGDNTRDIDRFTLINIASLKGVSANFFTKDGTNAETNWDRTSGNLSYIPAAWADALIDSDGFITSVSSPLINGGVSWLTRMTQADMLCDFGDVVFNMYDISGYIVGLDGEYQTGADAGIPLKLAAL